MHNMIKNGLLAVSTFYTIFCRCFSDFYSSVIFYTMRANHSSAGPPPPPIKRKNRQAIAASPAAGAGFNFANNSRLNNSKKPSDGIEGPCAQLYDIIPDTTIGFGVEVNGDMEFSHLLRVDGKFKGRLSVAQNGDNSPSTFTDNMGDLIIGEHGILIGDVGDSCSIRCMIMEGGEVIGNVSVEELVLLNNAKVSGKITAKFCTIGENAMVLTGGESVNIHPLAPEVVDEIILEHSDSNQSFISKQELESSPYASRPNQKRQVMLEKKRRRETFLDPSQPLFEVPSVLPLPGIPAKLLALWKNDKVYGDVREDRDNIEPKTDNSCRSDASIISKPTNNQSVEEKRPPDSDKAALSPIHVSRVAAQEEAAPDDGDDGDYEDEDGGGDEASTVNILQASSSAVEEASSAEVAAAVAVVVGSIDDSATVIVESEPAKTEDVTEKENTDAEAEYENDEDKGRVDGEDKEPAEVEGDSSHQLTSASEQAPGSSGIAGDDDATNQQAIVVDKDDGRTDLAPILTHSNATTADSVNSSKPQDTVDAGDDGNYEEDAEAGGGGGDIEVKESESKGETETDDKGVDKGETETDDKSETVTVDKDEKGGEQVHYSVRLSKIALKLEAKPDASHIFRVEGSFPASDSSWSASTPALDPSDLPPGMQELLEWDCGSLPGMEFVAAATDAATQLFKLSISKSLLKNVEAEQWSVLAEGSAKLSERVSISTVAVDGAGEESSAASQVHELRFPFYLRDNEQQLFATATVLFNMSAMYIAKL